MARVVIGLVGKKRSGKTTSFEFLQKELNPVFEIQIAGKLKESCSKIFKINRVTFEDQKLKENELSTPVSITFWSIVRLCFAFKVFPKIKTFKHIGKVLYTPREILQYTGTEILREIDKRIHLKNAIRGLPKNAVFIINDVRFEDEMHFFYEWAKPYAWFIYLDRKIENVIDLHSSEKEVENLKSKCAHVIRNNGTIEDLQNNLKAALVWISDEFPYIGYNGYKRQLERVRNF